MFAVIARLKNALSALAGNVETLAGTVGEVNAGLRERVGLDAPALDGEARETPALENGKGSGRRVKV